MRELLRIVAAFLGCAVLAYPFTLVPLSRGYIALSVPALLLLISALVLWSEGAITVGAIALTAPYVAVIGVEDRPVDVAVPVAAALLLLFVTVADAAVAVPPGTPLETGFLRGLALDCARGSVLALGIGVVLLAASAVPLPNSQLLRSLGIAAAALALGMPIRLLAGRRDGRPGNGVEPAPRMTL
ncbi:MAG TPA: hypothetical protein VNB94_12700 [Mycobacteriales bacterium]|nr:hypothetical protein [Mycobacteriales bacterium]